MRKVILGLVVGFGLLTALGVSTTAAGPTPSTTVILSCERNVPNATATVDLKESIFAAPFDTVNLSCGTESTSGLKTERLKVLTGNAGAFGYSIFVDNGSVSGGCVGASVTGSISCDPNNIPPGVKLTVR